MSIKSRKRREKQRIDQSTRNILSMQKQTMKRAFLDYLGPAIMFFVITLFGVVGALRENAFESKRFLWIFMIVLGLTIILILSFVRRFIIFRKINKIESSSEETIEITCKRVDFLSHAISRYTYVFICIIFTDETNKKYYNVVNGISYNEKKEALMKLVNAKVSLNCYANTDCVKDYLVHADTTRKK